MRKREAGLQAGKEPTLLSHAMSAMQWHHNDQQNAATIAMQMQADAQKQQMQRWKIAQDVQTKIFEMVQETTVHRAKTQDKMFQKWDEYVR
jgi:hypothetical protein